MSPTGKVVQRGGPSLLQATTATAASASGVQILVYGLNGLFTFFYFVFVGGAFLPPATSSAEVCPAYCRLLQLRPLVPQVSRALRIS